jgi:DNA-binding NtrC family response regulator
MRSSRILCVDSSGRRLRTLKASLERAGFEVWTALGAIDAVCLASGLHFDVLAVDQNSARLREEVWACLADLQPGLPILVHSGTPKDSALGRHSQVISSGPSDSSEIVLALLLLLLGGERPAQARVEDMAAA